MRIARLQTKNFRNLPALDVSFGASAVVVGENRSGKSNMVHALRLVLDASLPSSERRLTADDFWDGLGGGVPDYDPTTNGEVIEVSVEVTDFEDDVRLMASLGLALLSDDPMVARLTYRWAPEKAPEGRYRDGVYFGSEGNWTRVGQDVREEIFVAFLHALRDVENDIRSWRRSPLRTLLDSAFESLDESDIQSIRTQLEAANSALQGLGAISAVNDSINVGLKASIGERHSLDTSLRSTPDEPDRIVRSMQIYVDGAAARPLSATSLGAQNALYFTLLQLGFEQQLAAKEVSHTVILAEEPEAHLHPHVQRSLLRSLAEAKLNRTVLVTTHSPHVVSAVDARNLVRLSITDMGTVAHSARTAVLSGKEWDDINRYLGATQAEIVFASRVLLVEGYAEEVLMPAFARTLGVDLDKEGITVCAVNGTHFTSHARFCESLGIPWAILTDGDLDSVGKSAGAARAEKLAKSMGFTGTREAHGLFVGIDTLELDLYLAGSNGAVLDGALKELGTKNTPARVDAWAGSPTKSALIGEIDTAGGKGRFAQRIAGDHLTVPSAVESAIRYLMGKK